MEGREPLASKRAAYLFRMVFEARVWAGRRFDSRNVSDFFEGSRALITMHNNLRSGVTLKQ